MAIAWSGSDVDLRRRCPLGQWKSLFDLPGLEWYCFQQGSVAQEFLSYFPQGSLLRFENFQQTASALESMDLVITIDTALVHLSGDLGIPTYLLLPQVADWRWGEKGSRMTGIKAFDVFDKKNEVIGFIRCG